MGFDWLEEARRLRQQTTPFVMVTVLDVQGSAPREPGARMIILADGIAGTIGGGHLEQQTIDEARALLRSGARATVRKSVALGASLGQCCGGRVELFFEPVWPRPDVYLFGAGHVGAALAHVLAPTDFCVTVIDEREAMTDAARRSGADRVICEPPLDALADLPFSADRTHVVIMTHSHRADEGLVEACVKRPARYLGLIGSRTKWATLRHRLSGRGVAESDLARVVCPIGLPIGGKAPGDVAISVAAQLLQLSRNAQ